MEKKVEFVLKKDGTAQDVELIIDEANNITNLEGLEFLTADEIVKDILANRLPEYEQENLQQMKKEDLIRLHFGIGMWIRNTYGLWLKPNPHTAQPKDMSDKDYAMSDIHPDQYSFAVIEKLYDRLMEIKNVYDSRYIKYKAFDDSMKDL